jgi:hypothetical protein
VGDQVGTGIGADNFFVGGAPPHEPRVHPGSVDGCCPNHARDLACHRHQTSDKAPATSPQETKVPLLIHSLLGRRRERSGGTFGPVVTGLGTPECRHSRSGCAVRADGRGPR